MDPPDNRAKEPLRRSDRTFSSHRISTFSDINEFSPAPYDPASDDAPDEEPTSPVLLPRASAVSLDSRYGADATRQTGAEQQPQQSPTGARRWGSVRKTYSSLADAASGQIERAGSLMGSRRGKVPDRSQEEGYGMSLLGAAAPIDGSHRAITPVDEQEEEDLVDQRDGPLFDVTYGMGPAGIDFTRSRQDHNTDDEMGDGLGRGWAPEQQIRHDEEATSPILERSLSRSRSLLGGRPLTRSQALKDMYQEQANKSGKVTEVIIEEGPADLSSMEGPSSFVGGEFRRATSFPSKMEKSQVFYPQPNWKPFPMRLPWLVMLVSLSVGLALMQEMLYQKYHESGILKFKSQDEVKAGLYFAVKFGPTLAAVVYGVLWQFTDFEVRRLEAYYQLSKPGGALAAESINVDYVTCFAFFRPVRAFRLGHYAVAVSSIATTFAVSLVPTFAAASIVLAPGREKREKDPDVEKMLYLASTWSRLLTTVLCICAFAALVLLLLLQKRRSGLQADVRGIAGLASMAVVSHILMDFKDMDTASHEQIHLSLKKHRYLLRNSSLAPDDDNPVTPQDRAKHTNSYLSGNPHPLMLRPAGCIPFVTGLVLFMAFIPTFLFTPVSNVTGEAPWLVTVMAVCLKLAWHGMETAVRMMEPYYILSRRHAHYKTLMLDYTALPFGYLPVQALLNGHWLAFFAGFGTVMAEFLTVLVTGLATVDGQNFVTGSGNEHAKDKGDDDKKSHRESPILDDNYGGTESKLSFYFSLALALFILLYMTLVTLTVFFRRRHAFLPRQPNTIASVLAFIHQSKMLPTFVSSKKLTSAEVARTLARAGKQYGLGRFVGRDGRRHVGVDEEELIGDYKHGLDFQRESEPWNEM